MVAAAAVSSAAFGMIATTTRMRAAAISRPGERDVILARKAGLIVHWQGELV